MATYSEIKASLDEIAMKNHSYKATLARALKLIEEVDSGLAAMPSQYAQVVADVDQAGLDNPNNDAFQVALAEKGELVKDFQALKTQAADALTTLSQIIHN